MRTSLAIVSLALTIACGGGEAPTPAATPATPPTPSEAAAGAAAAAPAVATAAPAAAAAAPAAAAATDAPAADAGPAGDVAAGEAIYKSKCIACHQADGTGMGGALGADFVNDAPRMAKTDAELIASIANGVPGTTMIAWGTQVDEKGQRDVMAYIRTFKK